MLLILGRERDAMNEYGVTLTDLTDITEADCIILAVAHNEFKSLSIEDIDKLFKKCDNSGRVLIDVKGILKRKDITDVGYRYWRL